MTQDNEIADLGLPRDEALILDGADGTFHCLIFNVPADLLARVRVIAGDLWSESDQSMVLNYLLERGTASKEAELAAQSGQEELF